MEPICDFRRMNIFKFEVMRNNQMMHNVAKKIKGWPFPNLHSRHKTPEEDPFHSRKITKGLRQSNNLSRLH